ncbi:MAG: AEC family transporter [Flexilinea sp.]|nr:AEC family transporter [Flexilinea sp.]
MDPVIAKLIPIFILAFLGFFAGRIRLLPDNTSGALCSFLFFFCGPAVSFSNIITSEIRDIFNLRFTLAFIAFELSAVAVSSLLYKTVFREKGADLIIHVLCSFYGNISYVGIPVFLSIFNNVIPNLIALMIHVTLVAPVILFLLDRYSGNDVNSSIFRSMLGSLKNPNIFVPVLAVLLLLFRIPVPQVILDTVELLGKPTTTVGMFALGLTCSKNSLRTAKNILFSASVSALVKVIVCPGIAYLLGRFVFRLDEWWLNSLVILAMLPAALNDYIYSQRYHRSENFAGAAVLLSAFLFSITISLYILFIRV